MNAACTTTKETIRALRYALSAAMTHLEICLEDAQESNNAVEIKRLEKILNNCSSAMHETEK